MGANIRSSTITNDISTKLESLISEGSRFFTDKNYTDAIRVWIEALDMIPLPRELHEETLCLETLLGNTYFILKKYQTAKIYLEHALTNMAAFERDKTLLLLRLGQIYYETNDIEKAKEYLLNAYLKGGREIFAMEDPVYYDFLKRLVLSVE